MADLIGEQLGNYRLERLIGAGGYADVYLGEHVRLESLAAVKVLHTRLVNDEEIQHFQEEGRMLANLVHPHIIRVFDFDVASVDASMNVPFMVMEYAPNGSMRTRYPKGERLTLETALPYVRQIAEALQYAHDHTLVHRDIKPENLLLGYHDEVLLSDFGTALVAESTGMQSSLQKVVGTVSYMAPEHFEGKARPASDQYSLAIIIYEWLSGERPFQGTVTEIAIQHATAPPPSLRAKVPSIAPSVEHVIMKALAKDSHDRYASIMEFAEALEEAYQAQEALSDAPTAAGLALQPPMPTQAEHSESNATILEAAHPAPPVYAASVPAPVAATPLILAYPDAGPSYEPGTYPGMQQEAMYNRQKPASALSEMWRPMMLVLSILLICIGAGLLVFAIARFPL